MSECAECKRYGTKIPGEVYPCAICGTARCETHAVWVPAHEIDRDVKRAKAVRDSIKGESAGGWYTFCGRITHVPRGVTVVYGEGKKGGKIVERLLLHDKKPGLEAFEMWEVGIIEDKLEKPWEPRYYEISCELAKVMNLMAQMYRGPRGTDLFLKQLYLALIQNAAKRAVFFKGTQNEFQEQVGKDPEFSDVIKYICSRCGVVICLNRLAPFYNRKLFKKLAKDPDSVITG
jgi:hypothetical protein